MDPEENLIQQKISKLKELRNQKINSFPYKFEKGKSSSEIKHQYENSKSGELPKGKESYAGRIMRVRRMGRIAFFTVRDEWDDLQVVFKEDTTKGFEVNELLDIGDFIGVNGSVGKTKVGEISIFAESFKVLCKSIRPLPEKYHGIKDVEIKYRQRYVDLIMSLDSRKVFRQRHEIIRFFRDFLFDRGFIELETPILQTVYGGANARPFITHHNAQDLDVYLKISPELFLKRLIIGGFEKVFDMGKCFRNEGIDTNHNPEFTMLELYQAYADYNDMMEITETVIRECAKKVFRKTKFMFKGHEIDVGKPFSKVKMVDAIKNLAGIDVSIKSTEELKEIVDSFSDVELRGELTRGLLINAIFEQACEEKLIQPTFILDYPIEVCPLTKAHRKEEGFTERFELFIAGSEFANAYSELNDPLDQKERFNKQERDRELGDEEAMPKDNDFITSVEYGMPPTGGLGIGIDRLIVFLTEQESLRDIIPFVLLKPKE
ncbi:MAG TPA: lysine--tRNA ligase [Candidatus Woesearchaeota archaeon]|nr:lysine--tRNA ligase [Candidatus Woesearchaeota archaeon]